jgi:predicted small lipoprotein YifL
MTPRARAVLVAALAAAAVAACGQTGPLELPENARPIERVDAPGGPDQQQPTDDERQDER